MLEIRGLRGGYGAVEVLRGLDLEIRAGEIVAVLGPNGAGKSTLNNTISRLIPAFDGAIVFEGRDITRADYTAVVAAGLIHVPEGRRIFPNLTVLENLELGAYLRGRALRAANFARVIETFPQLGERVRQRAGTLSGGEQQMLAIGRGLMAAPRLLILDEPSLGLSPLAVEELFALVRRLNADGLPILLVEQNVGESLQIAHRAYVIENGAIRFNGTPAQLLENTELQHAYLGI